MRTSNVLPVRAASLAFFRLCFRDLTFFNLPFGLRRYRLALFWLKFALSKNAHQKIIVEEQLASEMILTRNEDDESIGI